MRFYQIDAFANAVFAGNPAGVCLVRGEWPSPARMQQIAMEINLSETAFVLLDEPGAIPIRWFTPVAEVPLCGHATMAAAHALFVHEGLGDACTAAHEGFDANTPRSAIRFASRGRILTVYKTGDLLTLDFPAATLHETPFCDMLDCFGKQPAEAWRGNDEYMLVYPTQADIAGAVCDMQRAAAIDLNGIIITAASDSDEADFVSRYFTPKFGIDEDPVTGSAHTLLVPYWAARLGKTRLTATQLSRRGGRLFCAHMGDRVHIAGYAVTFLTGEIIA